MDRDMPPRIAYWLSSFEPDMEAIASEVATLRARFAGSIAWGLSHQRWALISARRGYCVHPRLHLFFRAATRLLESRFDIHHIFGSIGDWFYLNGTRRRYTILTTAAWGPPADQRLLQHVDQFVVEHPGGGEELMRLGIEPGRIRLILPPVDLERFRPGRRPKGAFTALFASSPDRADWLEARGVPLILDAAGLQPQMRFRLLWRPWGDSLAAVRRMIEERGLGNVELIVGRQTDMAAQYNGAHVTLAPFTQKDRSKPAPNSLIESLACGRPVVLTEAVGLKDIVAGTKAGAVSAPSGAALAERLDYLESNWAGCAEAARRLAEQRFSVHGFLDAYDKLYSAPRR
jgi:glycosyltransferase involved in cell wall biosynthesis